MDDPFYGETKKGIIFQQLSDGVQDSTKVMKTQAEQKSFFSSEDKPQWLLDWLHFEEPGEADDRTAIVLFRSNTTALKVSS